MSTRVEQPSCFYPQIVEPLMCCHVSQWLTSPPSGAQPPHDQGQFLFFPSPLLLDTSSSHKTRFGGPFTSLIHFTFFLCFILLTSLFCSPSLLLFVVCCLLFVVCCLLFVVCCLLLLFDVCCCWLFPKSFRWSFGIL